MTEPFNRDVYRQDALRDHAIFITGGTSGINLGIAKAVAACGAKVAVLGRNAEKAERAREKIATFGGEVIALTADVRDFAALDAALAEAENRLGRFSCIVAGAAGNFIAAAKDLSSKGFRAVTDIDLLGTFHTFKASFTRLRTPGASLLAISSGQAYQPMWGQAHASAAKAGIESLIRTLALEWGPHGVRVNSLCPGPITGTEGVERLIPAERIDRINSRLPLRRFGSPSEIANAAIFLLSSASSYMTGTTLHCDGGMLLAPYDGQPDPG
jgi:NAD(P)-dependent dehydrogenase (short-subunit alcohol dehydrogenase family)